jgi:hypothetical protein
MEGFWFYLTHRIASWQNWHFLSINQRLNDFQRLGLREEEEVRPRAIWCDDKHGFYKWYIDYLVPERDVPTLDHTRSRPIRPYTSFRRPTLTSPPSPPLLYRKAGSLLPGLGGTRQGIKGFVPSRSQTTH